jgi:transcriptional/translational regulatory protein YebC/TACO1
VTYLFDQRSVVRLEQPGLEEEALLEGLLALEDRAGTVALTYSLEDEGADVIGRFEDLEALQGGLQDLGWPVGCWEHRWIPNTTCRVEDGEVLRALLRMLDALEDLEDVRSVTSNLEAEEGLMASVMA